MTNTAQERTIHDKAQEIWQDIARGQSHNGATQAIESAERVTEAFLKRFLPKKAVVDETPLS